MIRLEMKNYNMILIEKQPKYQPYHQAKLISMNIYLTGEEILPSNQKQIIEQAKFTYSSLGKAFDKQIKTIQHQGKKQVDALKDSKLEGQTKSIEGIFPKDDENGEIKNELHKIKRYEKNLLEITCFMNRVSRYMILKCLKQ